MDAKQKYVVDSVKLALGNLNDFLSDSGADFALRPDQLEALTFVFGDKSKAPADFEIFLSCAFPDDYGLGRILGRVYHEVHNPKFKHERERPEKVHVGRIVEHAFAMLHLRLGDSGCDLDEVIDSYPSARDAPIKYTLLNEEKDPLDNAPKKGKAQSSPIEKAIEQARKERDAEKKREEKDKEFKVDSYVEKVVKDEFSVPELDGYKDRDLLGDDALSGVLDKMRDEAFKTAKAIVDGRGDDNWKFALGAALYKNVDDAKKYLSGILGY